MELPQHSHANNRFFNPSKVNLSQVKSVVNNFLEFLLCKAALREAVKNSKIFFNHIQICSDTALCVCVCSRFFFFFFVIIVSKLN